MTKLIEQNLFLKDLVSAANVLVRWDSSSAASKRFGRCSLAADEDVNRPVPLTADEGVGRCSLAVDEEVGRPVLATHGWAAAA